MTLSELLKALVETEDQMERMSLVEANQELMNPEGEGEGGNEGEGEPNEWEVKYTELKKKYIDTFFGGNDEGSTSEGEGASQEGEEDEETKRAESITIDDVLKGDK